jgi:hypothetical protein
VSKLGKSPADIAGKDSKGREGANYQPSSLLMKELRETYMRAIKERLYWLDY